ncbi:MAG: flagellin [Clostridiales Family XIII bacterium]|jgi:flagellin|nr:flagellin [Clostridiales Family XIII bacterium]
MIINHNISALNSYNHYTINQGNTALSLKKLSSGLKINTAGDNAALLAISEKLRSQTGGLSKSISNAYSGRDLVQTAEGTLGSVHSMLQRMRELAVQAANDTNTDFDRSQLQGETQQLISEINRVSNDTEFNTMKLLDGTFEKTLSSDTASLYGGDVRLNPDSALQGGDYKVSLTGASGSQAAASIVDNSNVISSGSFSGGDVTVNDGAAFGTYKLALADNHDGTYTGTLTGPDGASSTNTFASGASANVNFGSMELDLSGAAAISDGELEINVTGDLHFTVANQNTGTSASYTINGYAGETIDLGGLQLAGGIRAQADNTAGEDITVNASGDSLNLQLGANAGQNVSVSLANTSSQSLGINTINLTTREGAEAAIGVIDEAISRVSSDRSRMGAITNRMDYSIRSLSVAEENMTAAESRIRDTDMAKEILNYTSNKILAQASLSVMAQSKMMSQSILQLLQ